MTVKSVNNYIADRPGFKIVNAGAVEGFFLIYYAPEDAPPTNLRPGFEFEPTLTVYYNQMGREIFTIEE